MSEETNIEGFFTLLESPQKNDVNRHAKDSKEKKNNFVKMQAFKRNQRTDKIAYRKLQSSCF
jgi:hypothetical protein